MDLPVKARAFGAAEKLLLATASYQGTTSVVPQGIENPTGL
jgi:hypothetical protein